MSGSAPMPVAAAVTAAARKTVMTVGSIPVNLLTAAEPIAPRPEVAAFWHRARRKCCTRTLHGGSYEAVTGTRMEEAAQALGLVPLFHRVDAASLSVLAREAKPRHVEAGSWLFREGDAADRLFVVISWGIRVVVRGGGGGRAGGGVGLGAGLGGWGLL